jgi:hypothetical protein
LTPFYIRTIPDNVDKETAKNNPILQDISNFDAFWYAMKSYQLVTADDLKNEFWSICTDLESINRFLDVMIVKFEEVNYRYDTDIKTIKDEYSGLNECVKDGIISDKEADEIFWNLHFIAERYNFIIEYIKEIYGTFRKMANTASTQRVPARTSQPQPMQSIIPDNILTKLEKQGFITKEPLTWLGSKALLAYFVEIANDNLNLKHGEKRQIKPFETMFNVSGIGGSINDYKKTGDTPIGHEKIDKILKES